MSIANPLRLAFMGTPDFAVPVLQSLQAAGHDIAAVYCQPPKPAHRGRQVQETPVHRAAALLGLEVRTPRSLRDPAEQAAFAALKLDAAVVAAYGLILPQAVLDAPRLGCVNIHFSLLPRWRGAAPVARAMLAGDKETGVCIMQMDAGLDTGPVLARQTVPIADTDTAASLLVELARRGAAMTLQALDGLAAGTLTPQPQPETGVTYAAKLTREDGAIDWQKPAAFIDRQIRALTPWPGTYFKLGAEAIKLHKAQLVTGLSGPAGTLLDDAFTVACGADALRLEVVQRAGKNPTDGAALLRGLRLPLGTRLP